MEGKYKYLNNGNLEPGFEDPALVIEANRNFSSREDDKWTRQMHLEFPEEPGRYGDDYCWLNEE